MRPHLPRRAWPGSEHPGKLAQGDQRQGDDARYYQRQCDPACDGGRLSKTALTRSQTGVRRRGVTQGRYADLRSAAPLSEPA